ncbi:HET-domain-containing protein, partial [Lentithecium fluviatile CBS 122367]
MEIPFRVLVSDEPVRLRPLDDPERQIRLLRIKSEPGFDEVEYEILVKNLDEFAGRYVAISYVWGEGQSSESIIIREEGRPEWTIKIGRNLSRVLAVLRYNLDPEYFWIDALCIEQTDIQEKNHQVPLMGKIYQSAFSTYVWLG